MRRVLRGVGGASTPIFRFSATLGPGGAAPGAAVELVPVCTIVTLMLMVSVSLAKVFNLGGGRDNSGAVAIAIPS